MLKCSIKKEDCWLLARALHIFAEKANRYESNTP